MPLMKMFVITESFLSQACAEVPLFLSLKRVVFGSWFGLSTVEWLLGCLEPQDRSL